MPHSDACLHWRIPAHTMQYDIGDFSERGVGFIRGHGIDFGTGSTPLETIHQRQKLAHVGLRLAPMPYRLMYHPSFLTLCKRYPVRTEDKELLDSGSMATFGHAQYNGKI